MGQLSGLQHAQKPGDPLLPGPKPGLGEQRDRPLSIAQAAEAARRCRLAVSFIDPPESCWAPDGGSREVTQCTTFNINSELLDYTGTFHERF